MTTGLIDLGAMVSKITDKYTRERGLQIKPMETFLTIDATGEGKVTYTRYVKVYIRIPKIKGYQEDVLLMVILNGWYGEQVPIQEGI